MFLSVVLLLKVHSFFTLVSGMWARVIGHHTDSCWWFEHCHRLRFYSWVPQYIVAGFLERAFPKVCDIKLMTVAQLHHSIMELCRYTKNDQSMPIFEVTSPGYFRIECGHPPPAFFYFHKPGQLKPCFTKATILATELGLPLSIFSTFISVELFQHQPGFKAT